MEERVEVVGWDQPCTDDLDRRELAGAYPAADRGFGDAERFRGLGDGVGEAIFGHVSVLAAVSIGPDLKNVGYCCTG